MPQLISAPAPGMFPEGGVTYKVRRRGPNSDSTHGCYCQAIAVLNAIPGSRAFAAINPFAERVLHGAKPYTPLQIAPPRASLGGKTLCK